MTGLSLNLYIENNVLQHLLKVLSNKKGKFLLKYLSDLTHTYVKVML